MMGGWVKEGRKDRGGGERWAWISREEKSTGFDLA